MFLSVCSYNTERVVNGVGTNFGVGGRRGEARRAESGEWGSWGGESQPLSTI